VDIKEWIAEQNEEALVADGFDTAIIGMCERFGANPVVAYNRNKCIEILADEFSKSEDIDPYSGKPFEDIDFVLEAEDYFEYNVAGSYVGENTPVFITLYDPQN
jgi:hypothetical protein